MKWQAGGAEASIHSARMKTPPLPARTPGCEEGGGESNSFRSQGFQMTQQITTLLSKAPKCLFSVISMGVMLLTQVISILFLGETVSLHKPAPWHAWLYNPAATNRG